MLWRIGQYGIRGKYRKKEEIQEEGKIRREGGIQGVGEILEEGDNTRGRGHTGGK